MIQDFIKRYDENKSIVKDFFSNKHPEQYEDVVKIVLNAIRGDRKYGYPDPSRMHVINDGDRQGVIIFVIPEDGYQPFNYFYVIVGYGSNSACDTLASIRDVSDPDSTPTDSQIKNYMTLALHVVQGLKEMGGYIV